MKVANTPEMAYLVRAELFAILKGLKFKRNLYRENHFIVYTGYVNSEGLREGVGITTFITGDYIE